MIRVVDLFCGMGGLSIGFSNHKKFSVTGYDINPFVKEIYTLNNLGNGRIKNLKLDLLDGHNSPLVVIGGPPCRPWSCVNVTRRAEKHPDYLLLESFCKNVLKLEPEAFIMENVIPIQNDQLYHKWMAVLKKNYSIESQKICYANFGAPTKRTRLFTIGLKDSDAKSFFNNLKGYQEPPKNVGDAIKEYVNLAKGEYPDHEWPILKTIHKYRSYYETGKFGWYKLSMNSCAPSFGNIMKTYILHPFSGNNGFSERVISIREAMSVMGFSSKFRFPSKMGLGVRYQMVADAVSPVFSKALASNLGELLKI